VGAEANKLTRRGDAASGGPHGEDETRVCLAQVPSRETGEAEEQLMTNVLRAYTHWSRLDLNADVDTTPDVGYLGWLFFVYVCRGYSYKQTEQAVVRNVAVRQRCKIQV
jgi:hypothetical protein